MNERDLMWQIVQCGIESQSIDSECQAIWKAQGCSRRGDFHVPEPWNGDIANAELLFLSINPGYTANEFYPRLGNEWMKLPRRSGRICVKIKLLLSSRQLPSVLH